jgi:Protein of unknown function (DUF2695)
MPSKEEKENRRKLLTDIKQKAKDEFENNLPIGRHLFESLFDHLDLELVNKGCNHSLELTEAFLHTNGVENIEEVKRWLAELGGYCDCEVLANVEEAFEK